jgi:hypothetical protein
MRSTRPNVTELSFLVCGVLIILVGWLADLLGIFEIRSGPTGHGSGGTLQLRVFLTMFGVAFATIGVAYENFPQILYDGEAAKRYVVAFLFLADGSLHLYAFNDHLGDAFASTFFGVFATIQLAAPFVIPYRRGRLDALWLAVTVFLILAYIVTRTIAVWPIGVVEEVEPLGVISKLVEVLTVLPLLLLMKSDRAARRTALGRLAVAGR